MAIKMDSKINVRSIATYKIYFTLKPIRNLHNSHKIYNLKTKHFNTHILLPYQASVSKINFEIIKTTPQNIMAKTIFKKIPRKT